MARAIGLDIGSRFIKVVEVVGSQRSFKIQRVAIREIPGEGPQPEHETDLAEDIVIDEDEEQQPERPEGPSREESVSALIREIFTSLHLPREDVCAAFGSESTVFREITVPFFEDDQIRKVVRFEAENHLHSYSVDEVVVNWVKTGETRDGSRLTIFASPKQRLAEHIAQMRMARVDPAAVDLDVTAIYTALDATGVFTDHPNVIVIDVGSHSSNLMLVVDGRPRVLRSFRLGVGTLETEIGSELGVSQAESRERAVARPGPAEDDLFVTAGDLLPSASEPQKSLAQIESEVVVDRRMDFVRKLHREAIRSLASVSTDSPPDRILLVGGGALLPGVPAALSERFGLPAECLDLLTRVDCKDPGPEPGFTGSTIAPALGCSLRMLGRNPLDVELLQDEFAPRNTFEVVRTTLATAITLLFLVIGVWTYGIKEQLRAERIQYNDKTALAELMTFKPEIAYLQGIEGKTKDLAERSARSWIRSLPPDAARILKLRNRLIQRHRFLQTELGLRSDIPQLPSAVKCWFEIYRALSSVPRERLGTFFQIEELTIQERRATVRIIVDDITVFDEVRRLLTRSAYFKERAFDPTKVVEAGAQQTMPGGRKKQSFSFKFREE